jgi:hypothetical protein
MRTHFAINAQVGYLAHFVGRESPRVAAWSKDLAQKVGLGTRSGRLGVRHSEHWAHAPMRILGTTITAAVASAQLVGSFRIVPDQQPGGSAGRCIGFGRLRGWRWRRAGTGLHESRAQWPGWPARVGPDDLARVEDAPRIEDSLEFPKHWE